MRLLLDAFGDDLQAECVCQADDVLDDRRVFLRVTEAIDEGLVDDPLQPASMKHVLMISAVRNFISIAFGRRRGMKKWMP